MRYLQTYYCRMNNIRSTPLSRSVILFTSVNKVTQRRPALYKPPITPPTYRYICYTCDLIKKQLRHWIRPKFPLPVSLTQHDGVHDQYVARRYMQFFRPSESPNLMWRCKNKSISLSCDSSGIWRLLSVLSILFFMPDPFMAQNGTSNLHSFILFISSQFPLYCDIHFSLTVEALKDGAFTTYSEYNNNNNNIYRNIYWKMLCICFVFQKSGLQTSTQKLHILTSAWWYICGILKLLAPEWFFFNFSTSCI